MARIVLIALVALAAFQGCLAKPKGKAAQQAPTKTTLEELTANAQVLVNNVTETLGIKDIDSKKVHDVITTNAQKLADNVQESINKFKSEMTSHKGEIDNVIKSVEEKLSETVAKLQQAAGPEATAKAKEVKDNFEKGLKDSVAQVDKLVKAIEPDATKAKNDIQNFAKSLLDQIVEVGNNVNAQIKSSISEHEKTHKKN